MSSGSTVGTWTLITTWELQTFSKLFFSKHAKLKLFKEYTDTVTCPCSMILRWKKKMFAELTWLPQNQQRPKCRLVVVGMYQWYPHALLRGFYGQFLWQPRVAPSYTMVALASCHSEAMRWTYYQVLPSPKITPATVLKLATLNNSFERTNWWLGDGFADSWTLKVCRMREAVSSSTKFLWPLVGQI